MQASANYEIEKFKEVSGEVKSAGYHIANSIGIRDSNPKIITTGGCMGIGILKEKPQKPNQSFISRLLRDPGRADFVANLWFVSEHIHADKDNWVMLVYGERHLEEMNKLSKMLSSKYNVNVRAEVRGGEEKESLYSDYGIIA